jgi:nucleoid-associated protein YgaU
MNRAVRIVPLMLVLVLGAGLVWFFMRPEHRFAPASAPQSAPPAAATAAPETPATRQPTVPSFDAVHIGPDGRSVIAGRAAPGAEVTVLDGGHPIGTVTADRNGEWVLMPPEPLAPGTRELSLRAQAPGEAAPTDSAAALAVIVSPHAPGAAPERPVAVLLPQGDAAAQPMTAPAARAPRTIALDIVEFDAAGHTNLTGRADPGAHIDVIVNDHRLGSAVADATGKWTAQLGDKVPLGRFRLRLEGHGADGSASGQLVLELRRVAPDELAPGGYLAVVPGNNLWYLAQRSYGDGLRYVEIYRANRAKIDNPDLIYPGQVLALPAKP